MFCSCSFFFFMPAVIFYYEVALFLQNNKDVFFQATYDSSNLNMEFVFYFLRQLYRNTAYIIFVLFFNSGHLLSASGTKTA